MKRLVIDWTRTRLADFFFLCIFLVGASLPMTSAAEQKQPEMQIHFDASGMSSLTIGGQSILYDGRVSLRDIVAAEKLWNPNNWKDTDPNTPYSGRKRNLEKTATKPENEDGKHCSWEEMAGLHPRNWVSEIPEKYQDVYDPEEARSPLERLSNKIEYAPETKPARIAEIVETITNVGGIIVWDRPIE